MIKGRTLAILFAAVTAGTLALAACGGDDDNGGSNATASPTSQGANAATNTAGGGATTAAPTATQQSNGGGDAGAPCSLVTQSEAEAALGEAIDTPDGFSAGTMPISGSVSATVSTCGYTSLTSIKSVSIDWWISPGADDAIKQMTQFVCSGKESISDLGDVACWYDSDHGELQLAKGASFLDLHATSNGDTSELLKSLAEKAVDRLP